MIPLVCVSVVCPDRESCDWGQWKHLFCEIKAANAAGRSRDCFQPGEVCPHALQRALHSMSQAKERWEARRATGLNDADLGEAIAKEFGEYTSGSQGPGWTCISGSRFWSGNAGDRQGGRRKPDLQGKALVAAVRELLSIPTPKATAAPWAGLPLMQMMEPGAGN